MWKTAENSIFILGGSASKLSIKQPEPVLLKVLSSVHFSNSYVDPLYLGSIVVFFVRGEDNHWKSEIAAMEIKNENCRGTCEAWEDYYTWLPLTIGLGGCREELFDLSSLKKKLFLFMPLLSNLPFEVAFSSSNSIVIHGVLENHNHTITIKEARCFTFCFICRQWQFINTVQADLNISFISLKSRWSSPKRQRQIAPHHILANSRFCGRYFDYSSPSKKIRGPPILANFTYAIT